MLKAAGLNKGAWMKIEQGANVQGAIEQRAIEQRAYVKPQLARGPLLAQIAAEPLTSKVVG